MRRIALTWNDTIVKGESYLFKSYNGAMKESVKSTTNPRVKIVEDKYGCPYFIALGDCYEGDDGRRKVYAYGKGGHLLTVYNV